MRAALFITCLNDTVFPRAGIATVELLERLGVTVEFPQEQTCCGQMHVNTGYPDEARRLARRMLRSFGDCEWVVSPSASCTATLREQYVRLAEEAGDEGMAAEARDLASRSRELCEFLVDVLALRDVGAYFPHRVAYHPACHGLRTLRLGDSPVELLRAVRGIEVVDLARAEECCGFGGTFAVKNAAVSAAMLADKVANVLGSGAEYCVAADSSCLMHIGGALSRQRTGVRTIHIAEVLAAQAATA